jgi:dephospho-CoA kinase
MTKIGITGSLASGKTTASKILSYKRGPLFCADSVVKQLYKNKNFKSKLSKKFKVKNNNQIKSSIKKLIFKDKSNIKKLEKIVHPLVRKKMKNFALDNRNKKLLFFEIPLLIESKLMKFFDIIIFIKSQKKIRLNRFVAKQNNKNLFHILNRKQMIESKKIKFCDYVVVNDKNLKILKKNLSLIITKYE